MRLDRRALNRTLLRRQHLLERTDLAPHAMVDHLIGLQAQDNLPPFLSLAARLSAFDPRAITAALDDRSLVRLVCLRGTIHLLTPRDALCLRAWTLPVQDRERKVSQNLVQVADLDLDAFTAVLDDVLADGPLPLKHLGERLAESFPTYAPTALGGLARVAAPLLQTPPRGGWKASGGVIYAPVDQWLGAAMTEPDVPDLVRRYLRAFGPGTAADVTAWSGVTRLGPVLTAMDDLVRHEDENGKVLFDVADAPLEDADAPAPVRLLGTYDNLWLSHAARDRVTAPEKRSRWMGVNGGLASALFVDGWLEGLWRVEDGHVRIIEEFRPFTTAERAELEVEISRVEELLSVPPGTEPTGR